MPHLTVQYTDNLQIDNQTLLNELNQSLWQSQQINKPSDLKSRILPLTDFLVGTNETLPNQNEEAFISITLKLLSGRSNEIKQELATRLTQVCKEALSHQSIANIQVCVEVVELSDCYHKSFI